MYTVFVVAMAPGTNSCSYSSGYSLHGGKCVPSPAPHRTIRPFAGDVTGPVFTF